MAALPLYITRCSSCILLPFPITVGNLSGLRCRLSSARPVLRFRFRCWLASFIDQLAQYVPVVARLYAWREDSIPVTD